MRVTTAQDNFTAGELSPLIDGRFSLQVYFNGLHSAFNWLSVTQGVVRARTGFRYVGTVKNNGEAALIPFRYSVEDRYMMEFGEGYIRFYRNMALVEVSPGVPYEVATSYVAADLPNIRRIQVGNSMYLVHPKYPPKLLFRGASHTDWTFSDFNPTDNPFDAPGKYPSVVAIFEQRLVMGATDNDPARLWFSKSAFFNVFTLGTAADDAFDRVIFQEELNRIRYLMATTDRLVVGTDGGESIITSNGNTGISPTNFNTTPQTYYGTANVNPVKLDNVVMFLMRDQRTVQSMEYDLLKEGFIADDKTITADHITLTGVQEMVFQRGKPNVVWCRRTDGLLIGLTYEPRQQVFGWHRHRPAGEDSKIKSVAVLPSSDGPDEFWNITQRIIDGQLARYIEVLAEDPETPRFINYWSGITGEEGGEEARVADTKRWQNDMYQAQRRMWHVDSAIRYDGRMTQSGLLSGLGGTVTLTTTGNPFVSGMVGREIWGANKGRGTITTFTNSNTLELYIEPGNEFDGAVLLGGDWYLTAKTVANLSHLEGETVTVIGDGGRYADAVVTDGMITLENPAGVITVGLGYIGVGATMCLDGGAANGPGQTKPRNIDRLNIRCKDTIGLEYGTDLYDLQKHDWRNQEDPTGRPPPLFSGDITDLKVPDDWTDTEKRIYFVQREPQPATILLLMPHYTTNDT